MRFRNAPFPQPLALVYTDAQTTGSVMNKITPPDVYVADTGTTKGRGVFASRAFRAGEIVEVAPVVVIPRPSITTTRVLRAPGATTLQETPLEKVEVKFVQEFRVLLFAWDRLASVPGTDALALGYGSLYNSASPANLRYQADPAETALYFIAERDIREHEEMTINYNAIGGGAEWKDQNWFVRMGVAPIP